MLPDLLKVFRRRFQLFDESGHSSRDRSFEHLVSVERIGVFHKLDIIIINPVNYCFCLIDVTKSKFSMVSVIQDFHQIRVEGVDIVQSVKGIHNPLQFPITGSVSIFHLPNVKTSYSGDFEIGPNLSGCLPVGV